MLYFLKPDALRLSAGICVLLLTACENQTTVQRDYVSHRDTCQMYAESTIGQFIPQGQQVNLRARNAKLVTLFSDCMFEQGWTVATPEREGEDEQDQAFNDDLPQLNDVPAGAAAARVPQPTPVPEAPNYNRRVPQQQYLLQQEVQEPR